MHRHLARTAARLERLLRHRLEPAVLAPVCEMAVAMSAPQFRPEADPGPLTPVALPVAWGPAWHTTWFHLTGTIPEDWAGLPVVAHVDLGFRGRGDGFQVEGLVWQHGRLRHALQPDRRTIAITSAARGGEAVDLWVEAASNPIMADDPDDLSYRPTVMGDPATSPHHPLYVMRRAQLAVVQSEVAALVREVQVLVDLLAAMTDDDPLAPWWDERAEAVIGAVHLDDVVGTASVAREELVEVFARRGAPQRHRVIAVGHAHLDTAWLWPVREARRKARRTFANVADLADRYPEFRFAHSQAQHWAWIEHDDPDLFRRLRAHVAAGRLEPVGGMWVEADLNLTGGESLVRQFLHGQHAFHHWFGRWCEVGFLPDDFGYPASFPQLLRGAGCRGFFTQKLSWNETNRFPHHTFWWEGLDGSRVLTHFSPIETYNALVMPGQLRFAADNFADHAASDRSLMCFGHGDGGGGPTADMVERVGLLADVDGLPRVEWGTVADFFTSIEDQAGRADTWIGEIVLEKHRGTFTSQVATKQGNVACEVLLRAAEVWSVATGQRSAGDLRALWQRVLVEQFHDILPGSSIAWVHADAHQVHTEVATSARQVIAEALAGDDTCVANAAPVAVDGVVLLPTLDALDITGAQRCSDGRWAVPVAVEALASTPFSVARRQAREVSAVAVEVDAAGNVRLDNGVVRVRVDVRGVVTSLIDVASGREALRSDRPGARLVLHGDQPAEYDAWDIDRPDARRAPRELPDAERVEVIDAGPWAARVRCLHRVGATRVRHEITVLAGVARVDHCVDVDWHQSEQRLAFVMPVDVAGTDALVGVQFGHVRRARHTNTSWQAAHFEQVAHRFVQVGETRFGVALVFTGARGVDVNHPDRHLSLSLLRSPRYPDPQADRGERRVTWSVALTDGQVWGDGRTQGLEVEAQRLLHPVQWAGRAVAPVVRHDLRGVMVDTLKAPHRVEGAPDAPGDADTVVVRLWEAEGARTSGRMMVQIGARRVVEATRCDLLERPVAASEVVADGVVPVTMAPFEVGTWRLRLGDEASPQYRAS